MMTAAERKYYDDRLLAYAWLKGVAMGVASMLEHDEDSRLRALAALREADAKCDKELAAAYAAVKGEA